MTKMLSRMKEKGSLACFSSFLFTVGDFTIVSKTKALTMT